MFQKVLPNGLTVLCRPKKNASKVSMQLWYNVGSKHEVVGERGMAHFIEHMIFKGTEKMLSESDINMITHKLSGYCNAFTSYDYTAYLFDIPTVNWKKVLPVLSDCMRNTRFNEEHLFSEVKAVIQELKMYRDNYESALVEKLIGTIFEAHPYHHPIIGYKQDLWSLKRETLYNFYKKYYMPQNAALVVVGDVDPEDVFKEAAEQFTMVVDQPLEKPQFFVNKDIGSKSVTLIRDVQQATGMMTFFVPGAAEKKEFYLDVLESVLAGGKSSRLYKKLVDEKSLVSSIYAFYYDLFDQGIFFIGYKPKEENDLELVKSIVFEELRDIVENGLKEEELKRAINLTTVDGQHLLEDVQRQAYEIGKSFFAVGDGQYVFDKYHVDYDSIKKGVEEIVATYLTENSYHYGSVIKANEAQKALLEKHQEESDKEDAAILDGKDRKSPIEPGKYVNEISVDKIKSVSELKPQKFTLKNGMTLYVQQDDSVETAELRCRHKASYVRDEEGCEGTAYLMSKMLTEGTKNYPLLAFAEAVESYGMSISTAPGSISMSLLGKDAVQAIEFFVDMIKNTSFDKQAWNKVLEKARINIKEFWDEPKRFVPQIACETVFKNHPYEKNSLGTKESLDNMTLDTVVDFYKKYLSPQGMICSLVGNISDDSIDKIVALFEQLEGPKVEEVVYPKLDVVEGGVIDHYINRDQVVLGFAGLSVSRMDEDFYKISLFDQILTGGALLSMNTRLFQLREKVDCFIPLADL